MEGTRITPRRAHASQHEWHEKTPDQFSSDPYLVVERHGRVVPQSVVPVGKHTVCTLQKQELKNRNSETEFTGVHLAKKKGIEMKNRGGGGGGGKRRGAREGGGGGGWLLRG